MARGSNLGIWMVIAVLLVATYFLGDYKLAISTWPHAIAMLCIVVVTFTLWWLLDWRRR